MNHLNTAHMQIQTHRYALEQGALCVHVLYLEYIPTGNVIQDLGKNKRDSHIVRILQVFARFLNISCMVHVSILHGSCDSLTRFL